VYVDGPRASIAVSGAGHGRVLTSAGEMLEFLAAPDASL